MPIVVPRLHRLGEHVDDHQLDLTTTLSRAGAVEVLGDDESLESLLLRLPATSPANARAASALSEAVGDAIRQAGRE
jgi:UDP-N-acetylglucosamine transferase subunit ALG13